jgi:DNA polymerase III epsilon subunit-like protein
MSELRGAKVAVIDFETTWDDDSARTQHPVSVAVVHCDLGVLGSERVVLNQVINPECRIRPEATAIHGISNERVFDKPTFDKVLPEIAEAIDGRVLASYNLPFDWGVLNLYAPGLCPFGSLDPLVLAKVADQFKRSKKLVDVAARRGINLENAHDACADALATARVIPLLLRDIKQAKTFRPEALDSVAGIWDWTCREAIAWERWYASSRARDGKPTPDLQWHKLLGVRL